MRAKIFSIFSKLGFHQFDATLNVEEKIKLSLVIVVLTQISKYLDFKIGEVWCEITEELRVEGVRPVSPDIHCIESIELVLKEKIDGVVQKQTEYSKGKDQASQNEENEFLDKWIKEFVPETPPPPKPRIKSWKQSLLT